MLHYQKVVVTLNTMTAAPKTVPSWEVPVLEAVYGSAVEIGESVSVDREAPTVEAERERLTRIYGINPEERRSYVELAYGHRAEKGLEKAIAAAISKRGRKQEQEEVQA